MTAALGQVKRSAERPQTGAGQRRRPALLRRRPLPLRPAGQGPASRSCPHVSSMQLAFARVKESWEDAYLTSLAGRPIEAVIDRIRTAEKVGLFSSDELPPARAGPRAAGSRNRLLPGLRLRKPGLARRAGDPGRARRPGGHGVRPAQRHDPDPQAEPARPGRVAPAGTASSATPTTPSPSRCPSAG